MSAALAYLLTWTTYGTWLHGDGRCSVNRDNNGVGRPRIPPNEARERSQRALLSQAPLVLSDAMRAVVDEAIVAHACFRGWVLPAANVRTNHVHVVVGRAGECHPDEIMRQLKSWATRALRETGLVNRQRRVWTDHGSTRWIDDDEGLARAVEYVVNGQ